MHVGLPYRTRPAGRVSTLRLWPILGGRALRLLVVVGVIILCPIGLHIGLWSRVVTISCERSAKVQIECVVDETTLATTTRRTVTVVAPRSAEARGALTGRGKAWIELVSPRGETRLTSGFHGDKAGQETAATSLTAFFRDPKRSSIQTSFGSHWFAAAIFLPIDALLFGLLYFFLGQRLTVTVDREQALCTTRSRTWPLRGREVALPISSMRGFQVAMGARRRYRLYVLSADGRSLPLTYCGTLWEEASRSTDRLNRWLEDEARPG